MPGISKLESWASMTQTKFDTDVKALGFSFDEKQIKSNKTDYKYSRVVESTGFTEHLTFKLWNNHSISIELNVSEDLIYFYEPEIKAHKYVSIKCEAKPSPKETIFCYQNQSYDFAIYETKSDFGFFYTAVFYRR
ncbi:MAG: hypothetical protein AB7G44_03735 [Bacteroidia bacterium]